MNYLNLKKTVNKEAAAHRCSVAVLKNRKQPLVNVLQNRCSVKIFCNIKGKISVLESLYNKVAGLQLCNIANKNSFFHKTPPVDASEKFINFPRKHQCRRCNRFIFLINTTE